MNKYFKVTMLAAFVIGMFPWAKAQNLTQKYGSDSAECLTQLSLYREVFKQKNYKEAYPSWKWVKENCPMSSKYIFTNGPVILEDMIKSAGTDSALREAYIQELFDLFDLRIKCYPADEGYVLGRIGVYLWKYHPKEQYKTVCEKLSQSIDLEGFETSPQVQDIYFKATEYYMQKEKLSPEILIDAYDKITEVLNVQIDTCELKHEAVMRSIYQLREDLDSGRISNDDYNALYEKKANDSTKTANELKQYTNVMNNLDIRFSKYANCEVLQDIYGKKFATNKDERLLRQMIKFFSKQKCTDNDLFISSGEELYKIQPTASVAFYMGSINLKKKDYSTALNYFKEAVTMYEKESDKINAYIMMIECQKNLGQMSAGRETAYKIIKLNPSDGRAYLMIGDLYAASAGSCGLDIPASVYWAAADKYNKAKAVDPSRAEEAQKRINSVAGRFPQVATYFQHGYKKGDTFKVGCWINETTIVR